MNYYRSGRIQVNRIQYSESRTFNFEALEFKRAIFEHVRTSGTLNPCFLVSESYKNSIIEGMVLWQGKYDQTFGSDQAKKNSPTYAKSAALPPLYDKKYWPLQEEAL